MAWRFRKSIKLGKGVRLNFNKKSAGLSFGGKGTRYSMNSDGRKTFSFGIPGTGLYWTETHGKNSKSKTGISGVGCLLWILFWPFLIIYHIFKGICSLFKRR